MKNILLPFFFVVALVACNSKRTLVDDINDAASIPSQIVVDTLVFNNQGRNLIYLLDPSCSVCIGNYIMFIKAVESSMCKYDSLFTIVLNDDYLIDVEYYLDRDGVCRPKNERYIIDNHGAMIEHYQKMSNNNDILLFDEGKLMFCTTVFAYRFDSGIGLVRDCN